MSITKTSRKAARASYSPKGQSKPFHDFNDTWLTLGVFGAHSDEIIRVEIIELIINMIGQSYGLDVEEVDFPLLLALSRIMEGNTLYECHSILSLTFRRVFTFARDDSRKRLNQEPFPVAIRAGDSITHSFPHKPDLTHDQKGQNPARKAHKGKPNKERANPAR